MTVFRSRSSLKSLAGGVLLGLISGIGGAYAADLGTIPAPSPGKTVRISSNCQQTWICPGDLCGWKKVCFRGGCPDRYSCAPLYGAYGPYGGAGYWGAYAYGNLPARPYY
jgi:hypothetical protein